jgi:transcription-repair coupling factor (superfamily II helicase)
MVQQNEANPILCDLQSLPGFQALCDDIGNSNSPLELGLSRAARLPVLASLHTELNLPIVLITDRVERALTHLEELKFWAPDRQCYHFPEPTPSFYEQAAWGVRTQRERLFALAEFSKYHVPGRTRPVDAPVFIAPLRAVMTRTLPRRDFLKNSRILKIGQQISMTNLQRELVNIGYLVADTVLEPGQIAKRGGLVDLWPPAADHPFRLDFFGDELDSLREFDPASQRTIGRLNEIHITPAREYLPGYAIDKDMPQIDLNEFHIPVLHSGAGSFIEYLPRNALIVVDGSDIIQTLALEIEEQAVKTRRDNIHEGTLQEDYPVPYLTWSEIMDNAGSRKWLEISHVVQQDYEDLTRAFFPGTRFAGQVKIFFDEVDEKCVQQENVVIVTRQCARLEKIWRDRKTEFEPPPVFIQGTLTEGWGLHAPGCKPAYLYTDSEIFGWDRPKMRQRQRPVAEAPEAGYSDLQDGEWVVHIDHGIGLFRGLVTRTIDEIEREYLCVEYFDGDELFVPVHQADRISRYIGSDGGKPRLSRLGGSEWAATRERVKENVKEVARDLLEIYAKRQIAEGLSFSKDTPWQQELEASFPYIETSDQINAIADVKRDMESQRPMDRLLCGDVGYGKTEVALRAAFKAVMDGKQVAMLVPTTVLAQQHFETFHRRLLAFPVHVEMLSRFRTPKEQASIIERLTAGTIDIVIGTHRLLQSDVLFKDLGLVIIDEEQRFGVAHKEYFKKLRAELDVLTLTATPIPRTLYMALTGVRDISNINTPPEERLPIITQIGPYSTKVVRQAVLRELDRGGQVFFVHNRVQTIGAMKSHLAHVVPEARIGVAHGQMKEINLSSVMKQFTEGEIDILLCTSIIESGLDIPNANTLIVDRGDTFGLAQLYQLRGRVGRGAQRAYAYFFRHGRRLPTAEGLERLEVIAENTQLGAGYSIAMRDLEMRGAGELLGNRQHGYIAMVGFYLYTRLLTQAVHKLQKGEKFPDTGFVDNNKPPIFIPISVDLPIHVGIPQSYVARQSMRLKLYRRLANLESEEDLDLIETEFRDRFGELPELVTNLIFQIRVKLIGQTGGLQSITAEGNQIVMRFQAHAEETNLPDLWKPIRAGKAAYWLPVDFSKTDAWRQLLLKALESIYETRLSQAGQAT